MIDRFQEYQNLLDMQILRRQNKDRKKIVSMSTLPGLGPKVMEVLL